MDLKKDKNNLWKGRLKRFFSRNIEFPMNDTS